MLQYNTIQYNTIQYSTIQYNTIQHKLVRHGFLHSLTVRLSETSTQSRRKVYWSINALSSLELTTEGQDGCRRSSTGWEAVPDGLNNYPESSWSKELVLGTTNKSLLKDRSDHYGMQVDISSDRYAGCWWSRSLNPLHRDAVGDSLTYRNPVVLPKVRCERPVWRLTDDSG